MAYEDARTQRRGAEKVEYTHGKYHVTAVLERVLIGQMNRTASRTQGSHNRLIPLLHCSKPATNNRKARCALFSSGGSCGALAGASAMRTVTGDSEDVLRCTVCGGESQFDSEITASSRTLVVDRVPDGPEANDERKEGLRGRVATDEELLETTRSGGGLTLRQLGVEGDEGAEGSTRAARLFACRVMEDRVEGIGEVRKRPMVRKELRAGRVQLHATRMEKNQGMKSIRQ